MADINSVAQAPFNPTSTAGDVDNGALGKEDFMQLLIAQLANQDPLSPSDPTEFVSQLSQFSSLEQLVNIKGGLDVLAITQTAATSAQMVSFIGKTVEFNGSAVPFKSGDAPTQVGFELPKGAASVSVRIVDGDGTTVETRELGALGAGEHSYAFDGKKLDGTVLKDGTYHVELAAKDANGDSISIEQRSRGVVAGVTFENGYPELLLADGRRLGLSQVLRVIEPKSGAAPVTGEPAPASGQTASPPATPKSPAPSFELPLPGSHPKSPKQPEWQLPRRN